MNLPLRFLLVIASLLVALPGHAALPAPVAQALLAGGVPAASVAVFVQRVDRHKPALEHRADRPLNPASTMKLLTTYAGLELLGPAYAWRTEFHASVPPQGEILDGDLILKGYGDPALTMERFWNLVRMLRQSGVRDIRGDLVLDRSYFAESGYDPAAFDGEPYRAYNVGPDALLVNFKATNFRFMAEPQSGKVTIAADPDLPSLRIVNQLKANDQPCVDWKNRLEYKVQREADTAIVTFGGHYSSACGEKTLELSVLDDSAYVLQLFKRLWQEQGGVILGKARSGTLPPGSVLLVQASSPSLADVIRQINKFSNNVMARQLLLTIAAERSGAPGSVEGGIVALQEWLADKNMAFPELVVENGAGLSRNERISAKHLGQLLLAAYDSPVMPELMASLPIIALDGTLQQRMKDSDLAGRGHLKSGSLDEVRAVAGYLLDAKGRRWVVVFIANHPLAGESKAAQDALLQWVYRHD